MAASTRWLAAAGGAISLLYVAGTASAAAPAYPPYPTATGLTEIGAWLRANTDVELSRVVGVGDESIFVLEPTTGRADPPLRRAVIRQEVISPAFARRVGGRSMVMTADVDCAGRRVFQRALNLYAGNNRQGSVRALGAGREWTPAPEGSFIENAVAAVCDPSTPPVFGSAPSPQVAAPPFGRAPSTVLRPIPPSRSPLALIQPSRPTTAAAAPAPAQAAPTRAPPVQPVARPQPASPDGPINTARAPTPLQPPSRPLALVRAEIGVFPSTEAAIAGWREVAAAHPGAMSGKRQRIELTTAGGATRFRALVDGFANPAEADAFCRQLTAASRPCRVSGQGGALP